MSVLRSIRIYPYLRPPSATAVATKIAREIGRKAPPYVSYPKNIVRTTTADALRAKVEGVSRSVKGAGLASATADTRQTTREIGRKAPPYVSYPKNVVRTTTADALRAKVEGQSRRDKEAGLVSATAVATKIAREIGRACHGEM